MKLAIDQLAKLEDSLRWHIKHQTFAIAGGAVRDALLGREVKDIDVFIAMGEREDYEDFDAERDIARRVGKAMGNDADHLYTKTSESGYAAMQDEEQVYATYEVDAPGLPSLNLIFVQYLDDALNEFPDTLSQVYMQRGQIITSEGFDRAREAILGRRGAIKVGIPTYLKAGNTRLTRLSEKYPEVMWLVETPYRSEGGLIADDFTWV